MKASHIFFLLILLSACNTADNSNTPAEAPAKPVDPLEQLRAEVMAIHDETMKYMGDIKKAKKNLANPEMTKGSEAKEIKTAIYDLDVADDLMMEWMRDYKEPNDPAAMEKYLQEQLVKIKRVDKAIMHSMEQAKKILEK